MTNVLRALLIEDEPGRAEPWIDTLTDAGFVVRPDVCRTAADVELRIREAEYEIILTSYASSDSFGIDAIEISQRLGKQLPTVVVTGELGGEAAVDCIRRGAADYVHKDRLNRLPIVVRRALDESVLRRHSQVLATALFSVGEGILIAEAIPNSSSARIVSLNSAFEKISGYGTGDLLGRSLESLQTLDASSDLFRQYRERLLDLDYVTAEITHARKDGTLYDAEWRISPIRDDLGESTHYVVILRDVTERKRIARELANSSSELARYSAELRDAKIRAERASNAKTAFLTSISHEIRTPMNVMVGIADLLSDEMLTPGQAKYVELFQRAGESVLVLINQLLDLAKIESGEFELECSEFDLESVLRQTTALFEVPARQKGLDLGFHVSADTPTLLVGDSHKLQQILTNLIGNALKFTETGSIVLQVSPHSVLPSGEYSIQFEVIDTGIGVPPEKVSTIFEPFVQAHSSTGQMHGTGLGLSITRALVERMKGALSVESRVGVGSTFRFCVAFRNQKESEKGHPRSAPPRVLLCEDSADSAFVFSAYLDGSGYLLEHVPDGKEGVERFKSERFDMVLMDMAMPVMDGHAAVRAIREWEAREGRSATPILALTAHAQIDEADRCRASGCTAFLSKPIRKAKLLAAIAENLPPIDRIHDHFVSRSELQEAIGGYLGRTRSDIAKLWAAIQVANFPAISTFGHQLKGSGSAYGFDQLSEIGAALEHASKSCDLEEIRYRAELLEQAVSEASAERSLSGSKSDRKAICC